MLLQPWLLHQPVFIEQQLCVSRCSRGMHIHYLIQSAQTLCGKFDYYSFFIGDRCSGSSFLVQSHIVSKWKYWD